MAKKPEQQAFTSAYKPTKAKAVKPTKPAADDEKPATYRIGTDLRERVNAAAKYHNLQKSSLVKFLIASALDQLESGELKLPEKRVQTPQKL